MKKTLSTLVLFFLILNSFSQCASDYIGDYIAKSCAPSSFFHNSTIVYLDNNKILINNFETFPMPNNEIPSIEGIINCETNIITFDAITYNSSSGDLTYSGTGIIYNDSIKVTYHQINPDFAQDICYVYHKDSTVNVIERNLSSINIFPNPAHSFLNIEFDSKSVNKLQVYNITGELIKEISSYNSRVNISFLENGLYILLIQTTDNKTFTRKFTKIN